MSISGSDFLDTARQLIHDRAKEADLRSSASRAYYAALHEARAVLPPQYAPGIQDWNSQNSHVVVLDALDRWGKNVGAGRFAANQMRRHLARLKGTRKIADYTLDTDFSRSQAEDAIIVARRILDFADDARRLSVA